MAKPEHHRDGNCILHCLYAQHLWVKWLQEVLLCCVYIAKGYVITLATVTVIIYLSWPPWVMQHR